jgi:Cu/Zn superoxide dismutase
MMKALPLFACALLAAVAQASYRANMSVVAGDGTGRSVGQVTIAESTQGGIIVRPNLRDLPPGQHPLHLQDGAPCSERGRRRAPLAELDVNEYGFAAKPFAVSGLSLEALRNKSLVVEATGHRLASGETADRVACGTLARSEK